MYLQDALLNIRATSQIIKDTNFGRKQKARAMKLIEKNGKGHRLNTQFSHKNNRCLHCTGKHQTCDCPIRQQQQATTTSNPASGTGIYQSTTSQFLNTLPPHSLHSQQHSQQSQSTVGVTTPTLTVTNPQFPQSLQHPPPAPVPQVNQQLNYQVRPPQFNQQFTQPSLPQVSPLLMPPQLINPQVPPPYFPQYPPSNSPSAGSNNSSILAALQKQWEKQERIDKKHFDMERQKEERKRMKEEKEQKKEEQKRLEKCENQQHTHINKAFEKIPRFDGNNPSYCFEWLEQTEAMVNEHQGMPINVMQPGSGEDPKLQDTLKNASY